MEGNLTIVIPMDHDDTTVKLEVRDTDASIEFLDIFIDEHEFLRCLRGLGHADCTLKARGLDKVGLKQEYKQFEFRLSTKADYKTREKEAIRDACALCPEGWKIDRSFGSQSSFFEKDGLRYGRTKGSARIGWVVAFLLSRLVVKSEVIAWGARS